MNRFTVTACKYTLDDGDFIKQLKKLSLLIVVEKIQLTIRTSIFEVKIAI